ncbi:hypothetical protein BV20DRAFT_1112709 [Pilatotrama ljubarskyi]|nr:hypothetical protein BV20DRAFT_1112709 [Pilatotrama ljubarskyi]
MPSRAPTKKDLEDRIAQMNEAMMTLQLAHEETERELQTTRGLVQRQQEELTAARDEVIASRAQVTATEQAAAGARAEAEAAWLLQIQLQEQLQAVAQAPAVQEAPVHLPEIPRPTGTGWSIREAMEVDHADYAEIQRTIRSLVIRSQLDWTDDFRRQDPDRLATFFRAARKAHPVLRRYMNNWAAAAIARQYMQNKRKHAYKQGYIKKKPGPGDQDDQQRRDAGGDGGAGAAPPCKVDITERLQTLSVVITQRHRCVVTQLLSGMWQDLAMTSGSVPSARAG